LDDVKKAVQVLPPLAEREAINLAPSIRKMFFDTASISVHPGKKYKLPFQLEQLVSAAGLSAFYPSRDYYKQWRKASTIDEYVSTARSSVVMVSINLMTGVPFDGLCEALEKKLESNPIFTVLISLVDPSQDHLMQTLAPALAMTASNLESSIRDSLRRLNEMRSGLSESARSRFTLRVHRSIPLGSAILLDHTESHGRIQIESKVYKAPFSKSFAFEVVSGCASGIYETLAKGYNDLVQDGENATQ